MSGRSSSAQRAHSAAVRSATRDSITASAARAQASASIQPSLSRPTMQAIVGKQTATLKTNVTDEVSDEFTRWSREHGYASVSDCLRELVLVTVYGPEYLTDLHRQRIESLVQGRARTVPELQR